jgi:hypothetical protein
VIQPGENTGAVAGGVEVADIRKDDVPADRAELATGQLQRLAAN